MMENNIVSWITGKSDLKQVPLQELKDIVHQYPYFTLAQLLLTVKMKRENDPDYTSQLQKTALNFQNPQWLHFQLDSLNLALDEQDANRTPITTEAIPTKEIIDQPSMHSVERVIEDNQPIQEATEVKPELGAEEQTAIEAIPVSEDTGPEHINEAAEENLPIHEATTSEQILETTEVEPEPGTEEQTAIEAISVTENTEPEHINEAAEENLPIHEATEVKPELGTEEQTAIEAISVTEDTEPEHINEAAEENLPIQEAPISEQILETTEVEPELGTEEQTAIEAVHATEEPTIDEAAEASEEKEQEEAPSRLSALLEAQALAFKSSEPAKAELKFDSPKLLPTKDYFASIGINTDQVLNNNDFGQKVRRFSDWLKQMKRVGAEGLDQQSNPDEEKIIMKKADASNKAASVVTETMVDILVQQGKKQEAIDTLEKLSLLKPEKSAYFASLINNLKHNN